MEFWGIEVKAGVPYEVTPFPGQLVHISQAALGETTAKDVKGAKNIPLRLKIDDKDLIIGSLKPEERTQLSFDLVFEKKFVLSHDWKNGSIYFAGYLADDPVSDTDYSSDDFSDESEEELEEASPAAATAAAPANGAPKAGKAVVAAPKAAKAAEADSDDDEDSEDGSDEDMEPSLGGDSSDDLQSLGDASEEDDSEEEEEELPKAKVQQSKKRPAESAAPVSAKKAKSITPEKTGNKKGQNAAPSKASAGKNATGKTPPGGNKSKQSPKSGGGGGGGHSGKKGKRGGK